MSRLRARGGAVEVIEMMAVIPQTTRRALRIARVRQNDVEHVELRVVGLNPAWQSTPLDHRITIRMPALQRVLAALAAAESKIRREG